MAVAVQRSHCIPAPPTRSRASRRQWDVIVVGSGVGGSVTAGLLASHGAQVLVLEKNDRLGGILASYERDGFKIDVGSHLISRGAKGPLGLALRGASLTRPRFLTHAIPLRSRGMFAATAPRTRARLPLVGLQAARTLGLSAKETAAVARLLFEVFTLTEWELRRWDGRSLEEFILRHTHHPGAYFLFSFMASIFFVLPPWEVSAGEAIRDLRHVLRDYSLSYVEGGMDSLCHALLGRVHGVGGELVVGQRVAEVRPRVGETVVVTTEDGAEYEAHAVALNLAPNDAVELVAGFPQDYVERARKLRASGNAHQLKLALKKPLVEEGCIIGGVSLSGRTLKDLSLSLMRDSVEAIAEGRVSDPLAVYAPVPSNYDPALVPEGAQLIVASIYGPVRERPADPPEVWGKQSLLAMEQIIPGLRDELLFVDFSPVPRVGAWMGKSGNAAICNGQTPGQVGRDRLPVRTPLPGIYLCGDGAGGRGIGTELAASSAMEAVAAIEEQRRAG